MARPKTLHENLNLRLPAGGKARIDNVLQPGEDRVDLIRDAIEREVRRRERAVKTESEAA